MKARMMGSLVYLGMGGVVACASVVDEGDPQRTEVRSVAQEVKNGTLVTSPSGVVRAIVRLDGCTGTLLRPNWVLTAKHCVLDTFGGARGTLVQHDGSGAAVWVPAANVRLHPDPMLDVALLSLPTGITTGQSSVALFGGQDEQIVGGNVRNYGYGLRGYEWPPRECNGKNDCPAGWDCSPVDGGTCLQPSGGTNCNTVNSCTSNAVCADNRLCIDGHCCDASSALRTAILPVSHVFRQGQMHGENLFDHKYLHIGDNSQSPPQGTLGGDSGGPNFLVNDLVGVTGGAEPKVYAKAFRDWANGIMTPRTSGTLQTFRILDDFGSGRKMTGDFNNDGRSDLISFRINDTGSREVTVSLANANGTYAAPALWHGLWHGSFPTTVEEFLVGDVNGDALDDIVGIDAETRKVWVGLSNGSNGFLQQDWGTIGSNTYSQPRLGDVNGDGRDDVVYLWPLGSSIHVMARLSCGTSSTGSFPSGCSAANGFGSIQVWRLGFVSAGGVFHVGDFNGDNLDDLVAFAENGDVHVSLTQRRSCTSDSQCNRGTCSLTPGVCPGDGGISGGARTLWATNFSLPGATPDVGDMNGDGLDDVVTYETTVARGRNGAVDVALSTSSSFASKAEWTTASFCAIPRVLPHGCRLGDTNKDGRMDVFRFEILSPAVDVGRSM